LQKFRQFSGSPGLGHAEPVSGRWSRADRCGMVPDQARGGRDLARSPGEPEGENVTRKVPDVFVIVSA
jgi:hypothetical protein